MEGDITQYNDDIRSWAKETAGELKAEEDKLQIKHSSGSNWQRLSFGRMGGVIFRISFRMPRHAVFVHKGVGRGVPAAKAGSAGVGRRPKPWFNPIIDARMDTLADSVADNAADLIVKSIQIK